MADMEIIPRIMEKISAGIYGKVLAGYTWKAAEKDCDG